MSEYDEPIVTSRNALVILMHEVEAAKKELFDLKAAVRWLDLFADLEGYDGDYHVTRFCRITIQNDEVFPGHKHHARTLLEVLEK